MALPYKKTLKRKTIGKIIKKKPEVKREFEMRGKDGKFVTIISSLNKIDFKTAKVEVGVRTLAEAGTKAE
jgi:translation initiation factor 1 (eIF-1/SUI1)